MKRNDYRQISKGTILMNHIIAKVVMVAFIEFLALFYTSAYGAESLSRNKYIDPKGYFTVIAPDGWQIQEYKDDPRGKVKFMRPAPAGTMLLYGAQSSPFPGIAELIVDAENAGERMKQKYGAITTTKKITYRDISACRVQIEIP